MRTAASPRPGTSASMEFRYCTECASPLTLGHTAVEFRLAYDEQVHCHWVTKADGAGVFALLAERLRRL